MEIKNILKSKKTVLLISPTKKRNEIILDNLKELSTEDVCYITLNKTFDSMKKLLEKNKIDVNNIVFVDTISNALKITPKQTSGAYFLEQLLSLKDVELMIERFLRHNFDYIIFDSLTDLLSYSDSHSIEDFFISVMQKIKKSKTKVIFYANSLKKQSELIKNASKIVEEVIELNNDNF